MEKRLFCEGGVAVGKEVREEIVALFSGYSGEVRFDEPMAPYTTMKIGGAAEAMVFPRSIEEVVLLMQRLSKTSIPFFVLGGGSNLLVLDGGIPGVVMHLRELDQVVLAGEGMLFVEAGFSFPKLFVLAQKQGLSGLEFAVGIPGTVGGAVAMNAGIPGEETGSVIKKVTLVTFSGEIVSLSQEACGFSYRSTHLPPGVIVSAEFMLHNALSEVIEKKRIEQVKRRRETQPLNYPNVGSIFRNPGSVLMSSAGKLIEQVQLKGHRIGGAEISGKHANFIVNLGGATAEDVLALIKLIQERVFLEKGINLIPEIKIIGKTVSDR